MSLSINTNVLSLNSQRSLGNTQSTLAVSLQRLSTGLRINSAKDDAAGLAISERMTSQIKGMNQASRNVNDGISMLQVSEGALGEVSGMLQRGRELAIQAANATNSSSDKAALQEEVAQLLAEVDRIGNDTQFNGINVFSGGDKVASYTDGAGSVTGFDDKELMIQNLKRSWLEQSEKIITEYYGIQANDVDLEIILEDTIPGAAAAFVAATFTGSTLTKLTLNIDMAEVAAGGLDWPNNSIDQLIAHEMTHAVMDSTMNVLSFDKWFIEGAAEFIPGADSNLLRTIDNWASGAGTQTARITAMTQSLDSIVGSWDVTAENYATAYAAVRYLDDIAGGEGMKDVMEYLAADSTRTLDNYFAQAGIVVDTVAVGSTAAFRDAFQGDGAFSGETGTGVDYLNGIYASLSNTDTGAIGGADASSGTRITTFDGTIPDVDAPTNDPLVGFNEIWPDFVDSRKITLESSGDFQLHVGANANMTIDADLKVMSTGDLGIKNIDISTNAQLAIDRFDVALDAISSERARLGGVMSRLEATSSSLQVASENLSASRSRIRDADFAQETANLTRSQILQQAGTAMLAQANTAPQIALSLLS